MERLAKIIDPSEFWIQDYWNAWTRPQLRVIMYKNQGADAEWFRSHRVDTFSERYESYDQFDASKLPQGFIHRIDRLARIYNSLIEQEELNVNKIERVIKMVEKEIYGD